MNPLKSFSRGFNRAFSKKNVLGTTRRIFNTVRDVAVPLTTALTGNPVLGAEISMGAGALGKATQAVKKGIERPMPKMAGSDVVYSQ